MRILIIASAFNSLTQRVHTELRQRGHTVGVELALGDEHLCTGVARFEPDLILAPMLTKAVPENIWSAHTVLIVHPGPKGDRGPSSLDWAITTDAPEWGVTVLQAVAEMDAGPIWASESFPMRAGGKSDLYRNEVSDAALRAVLLAVERFEDPGFEPEQLDYERPDVVGQLRPYLSQEVRSIDWSSDSTEVVLRKLRGADSHPGVLDELFGLEFFLHGGHREDQLRGNPGTVIATRNGAICRATTDGAVWLPQLRARRITGGPKTFKQPAVLALGGALPTDLPEITVSVAEAALRETWSELRYYEVNEVGYLEFAYAGGAMSTKQCQRLLEAYRHACTRLVNVLVLGPTRDFFSNGIHLNVIEAADDPAEESWRNINAIDDLVEAILTTTDKLVISALPGNAAAGGVMLALAADEVWCRESVVLNPHYQLMGLHGSEYWTYTLPRRVGSEQAHRLTREPLPVGARAALRLGLVDRVVPGDAATFRAWVRSEAAALAADPALTDRLMDKKRRRTAEEAEKPLSAYRSEELERMQQQFRDPHEPYHQLRRNFVHKACPTATPAHLLG